MPGCPEHSPGILLSSICRELVTRPRRKRRKSCFILSAVQGLEGSREGKQLSEEGRETDLQCPAASGCHGSVGHSSSFFSPLLFRLLHTVRPDCWLHLPQHPHRQLCCCTIPQPPGMPCHGTTRGVIRDRELGRELWHVWEAEALCVQMRAV